MQKPSNPFKHDDDEDDAVQDFCLCFQLIKKVKFFKEVLGILGL